MQPLPEALPPIPHQLESTPGKNGLEVFESSDDLARWAIETGALYKICIDAIKQLLLVLQFQLYC